MSVNNNNNNNISPGGQTFNNNNPGEQQPATPAPAYNNDGDASVESDDADDGEIDLHNKEFCVDVSSYQPVVWEERPGETCVTEWRMMCEDRAEEVCQDVTETSCDVSDTTLQAEAVDICEILNADIHCSCLQHHNINSS